MCLEEKPGIETSFSIYIIISYLKFSCQENEDDLSREMKRNMIETI